jgi:hypothetical protein
VKEWIIPTADASFVCAMEEVLDVYERPYDPTHPVVNLDESPWQLVSETQQGFTDKEGVVDLFMICEPLAGQRQVLVKASHDRLCWAETVAFIANQLHPHARKITIVQDNLSAHQPSALYELLPPQQARNILKRIEFVHTPKHGSWLNVAEIELSVLKRVGLARRIPDRLTLQQQIHDYLTTRNNKGVRINWQFTTKDARLKLNKLYPSLEP